jgi:hypothetical protein
MTTWDRGIENRAYPKTAAAEVVEHKPYRITDRMLAEALDREKTMKWSTDEMVAAAREAGAREMKERCAQVALDYGGASSQGIAANILALKDKPKDGPCSSSG